MKVLQFLILSLFLTTFAKAQACGYTFLTIYLTEADGQIIKNAKITTFDKDFKNKYYLYPEKSYSSLERRLAWSEEKRAYFGSEGLCGGHRDIGFRISAENFETFDKVIDLPLGWTSYSISLKRKNSNDTAKAEKLSHFTGRISDVNEAVITFADLEINDENGKTYVAKSNEAGIFRVDLPTGNYTIKVSKMGFLTQKIINFRIDETKTIFLDITLKVRGCEDCNGGFLGANEGMEKKEEILDYQILKRKNNN